MGLNNAMRRSLATLGTFAMMYITHSWYEDNCWDGSVCNTQRLFWYLGEIITGIILLIFWRDSRELSQQEIRDAEKELGEEEGAKEAAFVLEDVAVKFDRDLTYIDTVAEEMGIERNVEVEEEYDDVTIPHQKGVDFFGNQITKDGNEEKYDLTDLKKAIVEEEDDEEAQLAKRVAELEARVQEKEESEAKARRIADLQKKAEELEKKLSDTENTEATPSSEKEKPKKKSL